MKPWTSQHKVGRLTKPMAEINIIPLVDVTLVLLIIFMATTAFVNEQDKPQTPAAAQKELPLHLPVAASASSAPQAEELLVISVDKDGKKYLGAQAIETTALMQRVKDAAVRNPEQRVRIDADRDTRFQAIVEVIELCEFEGLHNIGLHTAPDKQ